MNLVESTVRPTAGLSIYGLSFFYPPPPPMVSAFLTPSFSRHLTPFLTCNLYPPPPPPPLVESNSSELIGRPTSIGHCWIHTECAILEATYEAGGGRGVMDQGDDGGGGGAMYTFSSLNHNHNASTNRVTLTNTKTSLWCTRVQKNADIWSLQCDSSSLCPIPSKQRNKHLPSKIGEHFQSLVSVDTSVSRFFGILWHKND